MLLLLFLFPKKCNDNRGHFNKCVDLNFIKCRAFSLCFSFSFFSFFKLLFFKWAKIGWQISIRFCPRLRDKFELIINNNLKQFVVTEPRKNVSKNGIVHRLSSTVWV